MGKISDALSKYAKERQVNTRPPVGLTQLNDQDIDALVQYDRETGHLLKYDRISGQVDGRRIDVLQKDGTIQRLLDQKLIYPSGKLTARGIEEARRLKSSRPAPPTASREEIGSEHGRSGKPQEATQNVPVEDALLAAPSTPQEEDFIAVYETEGKTGGTPAKIGGNATPALRPVGTGIPPLKVPIDLDETIRARRLEAYKAPEHAAPAENKKRPAAPAYDRAAIDPNLVALSEPSSYEAEQFKILRTNLLYPVSGQPPRSILVTSTAPGEGKTFVAANLAISVALNINKHVLLIDADLRLPQLHRRFGFGEGPGLSTYLEEDRPLPSLLLKTKIDRLTLLPGGPPPDNPSELLSSERMANLLAEVTSRYGDRLIVIDAPPPTLTAETGVLARQVDGILIVVRHGQTRRDDLADLISRLGKKKILGSIVNQMDASFSRYYAYNYGGYKRRSA